LFGIAPPDSPVPAPRATTGTPRAWQACSLGLRQGNGQRPLAVRREAVALVRTRLFGVPQDRVRRQHGAQGGQQPVQQAGLRGDGGVERSVHALEGTAVRTGPT
jgi:hypothetical protein